MARELPILSNQQIPWFDIQQEGKLQFLPKTNLGLGHALAVKSVVITAYKYSRVATIAVAATNTDNAYKVLKNHQLIVGQYISYSLQTKQYAITAIDTSNGSYDTITLTNTLGIAIAVGDTLMLNNLDNSVKFYLGTTLGNALIPDDYQNNYGQLTVGASLTVQVDKILQQGESLFIQNESTDKVGNISYTISGYKISADANFSASRVFYCLGDSIAGLSGYVTRFGGHHHWQVRTALNAIRNSTYPQGYDCRIVSDSMSGKTSTDLVNSLMAGMKVIRKADLIIFQHGVNDAASATTDAVWNANIQYMIAWRDTNYPNAKLVLVGASPIKASTSYVARLQQLRVIEATYHNPTNNVYYVSLENAYPNVSDTSPYLTDAVHPTQAGQDLLAPILSDFIKSII